MVTVPAPVWRHGFAVRALLIGGTVGVCLGALAWMDSGMPVAGAAVLVVVGTGYGVWMARRMARYWPESAELSGDDRVTVVGAARRGARVGDDRLSAFVASYARGLHAAADGRLLRWVVGLVLVVGVGTTVYDAVYGSWGSLAASAIYLAALLVEVFWWPRRQKELLANADRAATVSG